MENARDHRDEEVHRSEQASESDSMNWTGTSPEDDDRSEVRTSVDLSGLYELSPDASDGTQTALVGESGCWPELDNMESQPDRRLDAELDVLRVQDSKGAVACQGKTRSVLEDSASFRSLDLARGSGEDRLARTIMDMTGWSLAKSTVVDGSLFSAIFTDGEKNYEFADWKIHITFCRVPGSATLDWSPETLEKDLRRAASVTILEDRNVDEVAGILMEHYSAQQIRQLLKILNEKT